MPPRSRTPEAGTARKPHLYGDKDRLLLLEDQERLVKWISSQGEEGEPCRRFVLLILQSGLRVSEACRLTIADCDVDSRPYRILVRGGKKREAHEVEEVIVSEALALEIRVWREGRPADVPLVAHQRVFPYSRQAVWGFVKQAMRGCGLNPKFGVHTLRHRFITTAWQESQDLMFTKKQARHRTLDQTAEYIHLAALETAAMASVDATGIGAPRLAAKPQDRRQAAGRAAVALELTEQLRRRKGGAGGRRR